ncbi:helix-turn-helix domain-containing protein [Celeribacter sp. ULVN23_4]
MSNSFSNTPVTLPALLTQDEVADYLRISPKTLERDRWLKQGLPFIKVGRSVRYRATDIAAVIGA